ncbi:pH regulation protein F [Thiohalocapsa sp.]|uniref:pH regulation protein F n=1 Tax=Thiohalocapsa sp. TaxID=2497641 RepID=UPI0025F9ADF7|nr:pH regulation protein F [Thiohalocapsa sp.]
MIIDTQLEGLVATAVDIAALFLIGAFLLASVRLILGPTLPDRVVALDLLTMLVAPFLPLFRWARWWGAVRGGALALGLGGCRVTIACARFVDLTPGQNPGERR